MPVLRIVTQNIWNKNDHWQKRADAIGRNMDELEVDIVCIQESMPDHFEYLTSHSVSRFPHAYYAPSDDGTVTTRPQGLAMFSRLPALETGQVDIGREREMSNPWMRNLQYMTLETPSGHTLTIFNTHLFISGLQKKTGIATCVEVMQSEEFADCIHLLAGDFNINLDRQRELLAPLAEQQYADIWIAKNGDRTGHTAPHDFDEPLIERIDGFFTQRDCLDKVVDVSLVNAEPINDGSLLLSDHIGVMAIMNLD